MTFALCVYLGELIYLFVCSKTGKLICFCSCFRSQACVSFFWLTRNWSMWFEPSLRSWFLHDTGREIDRHIQRYTEMYRQRRNEMYGDKQTDGWWCMFTMYRESDQRRWWCRVLWSLSLPCPERFKDLLGDREMWRGQKKHPQDLSWVPYSLSVRDYMCTE